MKPHVASAFILVPALVLAATVLPARAQDGTSAPPAQGAPVPDMCKMSMPGMDMSGLCPSIKGQPAPPLGDHMGMAGMPGMSMNGALGPYPMTRDASGASWQPDASLHQGLNFSVGGWSGMAHALLDGVYDDQSGPRGGHEAFVEGMVMVMASRPVTANDTLTLKTMLSPEPFMGPEGYPLLLQTGETANGNTPLIDRQHPHNLVMELAGVLSHRLSSTDSVFVYAGLPGEPALGPPAFMHRMSGMDDPEAPITHHWMDSTHITNGVLTTGYVHGDVMLEASAFHGREPDQHRFDIEPGALDSWSVRASWNPGPNWALQVSGGHLSSPEQLQPSVNEDRVTASAIYTRPVLGGWWSTTAALGVKRESYGQTLNGWLLESAVHPAGPWTLFARAETEQNNELSDLGALAPALPGPSRAYVVAKLGLGLIHDWTLAPHIVFGVGGLYDWIFVPASLQPGYDAGPHGSMAFVRLRVD